MKKGTFTIFAVTAPGLEPLCARELETLGVAGATVLPGGVEFEGDLATLYRANLWLRTASRVLVRVGSFRCRDFPSLYQKALRLPWGKFVRPQTPVQIKASASRSRLLHTGRLADSVGQAVDRALGRQPLAGEGFAQTILVRMEDDICQLSVDSSGELLHRRGYRAEAGPAPLRETLAAAMLMLLGWDGKTPLVDPMCGSGTLPIEAALLAGHRPPGKGRDFAFMQWPRYRPGLWQALLQEAVRQAQAIPAGMINAADRDPSVLEKARRNAERAGVAGCIAFRPGEISAAEPPAGPGLVLFNPPYGERLEGGGDIVSFYREMGQALRHRYGGWGQAFLCPDEQLARRTGLPLEPAGGFSNGGLRVTLFRSKEPEA